MPQDCRCAFGADGDKINFSRVELVNDRVKVFGRGMAYYSGDVELDLGLNVVPPKSESSQGLLGFLGQTQRYRVSVGGDFACPDATMGEKLRGRE